MVDDDNRAEGNLDPETAQDSGSSEHPGPRRSTWAPSSSTLGEASSHMSDDDLAQALEEDFGRASHTSSVPIIDEAGTMPVTDLPPPVVAEPFIVHDLDAVPFPVGDEHSEHEMSQPLERPDLWAEAVSQAGSDPEREPEPEREPQATLTEPPVRRSAPTAELAAALAARADSGNDPGEIMAQLEEQLRLREQDASEFLRWQESMVAGGSTVALAAVESAREGFEDIVDNAASATPVSTTVNNDAPADTHNFSVDEVTDSDLSSAPAPRTAPVSDIPPPPSHTQTSMSMTATPPPPVNPSPITAPTDAEQPSIPDLVEPAETPIADPFDFDALVGGTATATGYEPTAFSTDQAPEPEPDAASVHHDDVSEIDQMFADVTGPFPVTSEGVTVLPDEQASTVDPTASAAGPSTGNPVMAVKLTSPPAFRVEEASVEPTLTDQRVGRASRLFWLWFAANSSVVSLAFGGAVLSLGMSLRQAIVATLIGVSVSFLPLGLGTLAGKWSGQPTMIVSRATFGHLGNIVPAILAIIVRVFWGAVLLWFLAAGTARILAGAELTGPLSETQVTIIGLAVGFLLALVFAYFGYGLIARIQLGFTIISALLIVGLIVITWPAVSIPTALTLGDGPWILVLTGAVLVFSFVGLVWAVSSADLARYQRASGSGAASMLWSTFGATIPAFVLIAYGAVLAASNPDVAAGLIETPLDTISLLIPVWYPIPLIAALAFSLLSGVVISIYSGGFALQATGVSMRRPAAVVIVGAAVAGGAVLIAISVGDFTIILRDVATSLAVPIAAWAGIFGAEMMIRNKGFVSRALVKRGGVYPDINWVNVSMLIVASAIGLGLSTATVSWLGWQGYLFGPLGVSLSSDLAASDLGVFVALLLGLLTPIVAGIPGIRRQEAKGAQQQ